TCRAVRRARHRRIRVLQPQTHVHLAVQLSRGSEVLARLLALAHALVELTAAQMAVSDERAHTELARKARSAQSFKTLAHRSALLERHRPCHSVEVAHGDGARGGVFGLAPLPSGLAWLAAAQPPTGGSAAAGGENLQRRQGVLLAISIVLVIR